jgi:hypothetical protein
MLQVAVRDWPAGAVHDTVAAVMRTAPFRRSVRTTLLERLLGWLGQAMEWLARTFGGMPGGRTIVIWIAGLIALAIVARLLYAAQARDPDAVARWTRRESRREEDPWRLAERLAAEGDHEGAAHALYRGVLASLAERERLRLDPSKTSGDYARELRARRSASLDAYRAFARRFDDAVYGHGRLDAALVTDLTRLATPLRGTARAA